LGGKSCNNVYNVYIFLADNLAGSALFIPYFPVHTTQGKNLTTKTIATPTIGKLNSSDKFWYVDRKLVIDQVEKN